MVIIRYAIISLLPVKVVACRPPAKDRCVGWDAVRSANACGVEYAGRTCDVCAPQHYQALDTTCKPCPSVLRAQLVRSALPFVTMLVILFSFFLFIVWRLEKRRRSHPKRKALRSSKSFCMWVVASAQILATSSSSAVPGLPKIVLSIYGFVQFFNGDTSAVLHWECIEGSHFKDSWIVLSCIIAAALGQLGMFLLTGYSVRNLGRKVVYLPLDLNLYCCSSISDISGY